MSTVSDEARKKEWQPSQNSSEERGVMRQRQQVARVLWVSEQKNHGVMFLRSEGAKARRIALRTTRKGGRLCDASGWTKHLRI